MPLLDAKVSMLPVVYTPMAVVIDNDLPREPLDFIICSRLTTAASSIFGRKVRWRSSTYNGYLSFDLEFNCNTLTRCVRLWLERMTFKRFFVQSSPPSQTLPWEVSYVYQSV